MVRAILISAHADVRPVLLLGLFYGFITAFLWIISGIVCWVCTATAILVFGAYTIETSNIKLVGGSLMSLIRHGVVCETLGSHNVVVDNSPEAQRPPAQAPPSRGNRRADAKQMEV